MSTFHSHSNYSPVTPYNFHPLSHSSFTPSTSKQLSVHFPLTPHHPHPTSPTNCPLSSHTFSLPPPHLQSTHFLYPLVAHTFPLPLFVKNIIWKQSHALASLPMYRVNNYHGYHGNIYVISMLYLWQFYLHGYFSWSTMSEVVKMSWAFQFVMTTLVKKEKNNVSQWRVNWRKRESFILCPSSALNCNFQLKKNNKKTLLHLSLCKFKLRAY